MAISDEISRLQNAKAAIKTAIEGKGVTVPSSTLLDGYAALISSIPTGGGAPAWLKDGDTHLWINIVNDFQKEQTLRIRMIGTIDWGDGSAKDSANVTAYTTFTHTYSDFGKYRIDLHPTSGTFYMGGSSNYNVMGSRTNYTSGRSSALYQAEVGATQTTSLERNIFYGCRGLRRVWITKNVKTLNSNGQLFSDCCSLVQAIFEDASKITSAGYASMFYNCYNLQSLSTFDSAGGTTLGGNFIRNCWSLSEFTIPSGITSISTNAFSTCYALKHLYCLPQTPPTVANANAFTGFNNNGVTIHVPNGTLSAYQSANIWSTYASQIVEASLITFTLTSVSSSNKALMVDLNESYTTTLVPDTGKTLGTVTVKMGGTDITSTAYSAGVVTIASVTGNIEITASAS